MGMYDGAPSCADALTAIDENQRKDGYVKSGLNHLVLFNYVFHNVVISLIEQIASQLVQSCENISSRGCVFSILVTSSELPDGLK